MSCTSKHWWAAVAELWESTREHSLPSLGDGGKEEVVEKEEEALISAKLLN